MAKYLTVDELYAEINAIAGDSNFSGLVSVFDLSNKTEGGRNLKCLRINKATPGVTPIPVLITGGIHAREWCPPEALVDFARRLLTCFKSTLPYVDPRFVMTNSGKDVKNDPGYTGKIVFDETDPALFAFPDIERVLKNVELFIVPLVNPDGRAFSQLPGDIPGMTDMTIVPFTPLRKLHWRKNRRDMGKCADGSDAIGVDLNRSFNRLPCWDINLHYDNTAMTTPTIRENISVSTVADSCKKDTDIFFETFHGSPGVTEKETQCIMDLVQNKKIKFFLDIHSHQREIYYPWGSNPNQVTDAFQSMYNSHWDNAASNPVATQKGRPYKTIATYSEYFPVDPTYDLFDKHQKLAAAMQNMIMQAAGSDPHAKKRSDYKPKQSFTLYAAPGNMSDYIFSTQLEKDINVAPKGFQVKLKPNFPIYSLTIEIGHVSDGEFWPSKQANLNQFLKVRREGQFAVIGLLKFVANWVAPITNPPANPSPGGSSSSSKGCFGFLVLISIGLSMLIYGCFSFIQYFF